MSNFGVPIIRRGGLDVATADAVRETGALLLVDKPLEWTSFDVVAKVRNTLRIKKVGHAGTLDPLATGLLILCLGKATKLADSVQAEEKEYTGRIRIGARTATDDSEGEETDIVPVDGISPEMIRNAAESFLGESEQIPPMFSARKVQGKRLYKLARQGKEIDRPAKTIRVTAFDIGEVKLPYVEFRIQCSKGTYIRSLARDLGSTLETGAYLAELRRTRSGAFHVDEAVRMDEILALSSARKSGPAPKDGDSGAA